MSKTKTTTAPAGATAPSFFRDRGRVKIGGGGKWDGALWFPHEPTANATEQAAANGNEIVRDAEVGGRLYPGTAFGKPAFFLTVGDNGDRLLLPEHGGLMMDCASAVDAYGPGVAVDIVYKGAETIRKGKWAGKAAHTYEIFKVEG